jgi:hypothetical protein
MDGFEVDCVCHSSHLIRHMSGADIKPDTLEV